MLCCCRIETWSDVQEEKKCSELFACLQPICFFSFSGIHVLIYFVLSSGGLHFTLPYSWQRIKPPDYVMPYSLLLCLVCICFCSITTSYFMFIIPLLTTNNVLIFFSCDRETQRPIYPYMVIQFNNLRLNKQHLLRFCVLPYSYAEWNIPACCIDTIQLLHEWAKRITRTCKMIADFFFLFFWNLFFSSFCAQF